MKLKEDAAAGAISAGAIAGVRTCLGRVKRVVPMTEPIEKKKKKKATPIKESKFSTFLKEFSGDPNSADVIGKLSQNAKQSDDLDGDGVATYGLETDEGEIVKVLVAREQAKDFEKALGDAMQDQKDNTQQDIAELLFDLNDKFHIVDVVWPTIQEDEEEQAPGAGDPNAAPAGGDPAMGDPNAPPGDPGDPNAPPMGDPNDPNAPPMDGMDDMGGGDGDVKGALDQIIDFLKSDAEARKADAEAKTAEARAREAEAAAKTAEVKLGGEEQILDAESYFNAKKDEQKEANRLKMLAKYRQETKTDGAGDSDASVSQMDMGGPKGPQGGSGGRAEEEEQQTTLIRKTLLRLLRGH